METPCNAYLGSKSFVILGSNKQTGDSDQLESVQRDSLIGKEPVHQFNSQVQSLLGELLVNLENQDRFRYYTYINSNHSSVNYLFNGNS